MPPPPRRRRTGGVDLGRYRHRPPPYRPGPWWRAENDERAHNMGVHMSPLLFEEQHLVRIVDRNGEPWFVGSDIATILGHRDATAALRGLDEDEKGTHILCTPGGDQEVLVVSEAGVYRLVFTSRKPVAERMKRWLAHEVIPAIRKNGFYDARAANDVIPPTPVEQRPFPDWPMDELRSKRGVVDMYRMLYGVMAAQWISPQMGFPAPPLELVEHGRQFTLILQPKVDEAA